MNMVRSILSAKGMPKTFWPEAVNWAIYVLNRCPTFALTDLIPQEAWSGVKPSMDHFWVFGCLAHVHIPDVKRTKLDNKSFPCVLLGMSEESKGYRLFDPVKNRVVVSRDVIFEEDKQWDWVVSYADQLSFDLVWGDSNNGDLGVREGNDEERRELGDDSMETFEEEAEDIVSVAERRDVENHEREENATGRSAQSGSHYAHPPAAASPAGRVGENPSYPTARVLPDSGMDDRGDLTASSGHDGSASGNPTARRHDNDSTGDRGAYFNPTADFWASENRVLTCGRRERVSPN